jgi:hypothetical protein
LYEYQKKGLTKIAIRKSLILKGAILVVLDWQTAEMADLKRKSGSELPLFKTQLSTGLTIAQIMRLSRPFFHFVAVD